jgi:hypothetical protein
LPSQYYFIQNRHDNRNEQTQNLKFNIDYSPNEKNNFNLIKAASDAGVKLYFFKNQLRLNPHLVRKVLTTPFYRNRIDVVTFD